MAVCAVPGCSSNSILSTDYTFHRLPINQVQRARWIAALGPLPDSSYVCSRHFELSLFTKRGTVKMLWRSAVPTLFLNKSPQEESSCDVGECSDEDESSEVVACRVCLAVAGRLLPISSSGLEDTLASLTGAALPTEENVPHHLCAFCAAKLSKYAAFRDSCQRSTALLQTLLERGSLNMDSIKSYSCKMQQEIRNLTSKILYQFGTGPVLEISPLIKTENYEHDHDETEYTEVEYLDNGDFMNVDDDDDNKSTIECSEEQETQQEHATIVPEVMEEVTINPNLEENEEPPVIFQRKATRKVNPGLKNNVALGNSGTRTRTRARTSRVVMVTDICDDMSSFTKSKTDNYMRFEKEFNFEITLLSEEEQKQKIEENKMRNSSCSCDLCGKEYARERTLAAHKNTYHDPSLPVECNVCRYRFGSVRELRIHRQQDRHRAIFTCNECGQVFRCRSLAKEHYFMHRGKTYTCPYCSKVYGRLCSYYGHIQVRHPGENEACDECGETFKAGQGLMVHKAMTHKADGKLNAGSKCTVCDVTFMSAEALQRHTELSAGSAQAHAALWPCAACGDSCGSEAWLAQHAKDKHPPDQHYCKECDKSFASAASFEQHVDRKHQNRRRRRVANRSVGSIVCEICGKVFINKTLMEAHMNGHLGLKPFQCRVCPKAFISQARLRLHMRTHTGERPYQCEQCPMAFALQGNYTRHLKNVHLRMQVKCELCGKQVGAASMPSHVRAVHWQKPYVRKRKRDRPKKPLRDTET